MSGRIDIIQDGYSRISETSTSRKIQQASGSCCLVRSSGLTILFDTMGPWEKDLLLQKLDSFKIHSDDIDYVIGSHGHADHIGNMNLFRKCKRQFIGICSYFQDLYFDDHFNENVKLTEQLVDGYAEKDEIFTYKPDYKIDTNTCIIATPGHTHDDVSLIIENCDKLGKVALAGDLFERAEDVDDESIWIEAGSVNHIIQRYNRSRLYSVVDWILPGHGPLFRTKH